MSNSSIIDRNLVSIANTEIIKGVGIMLMLLHHLFYSPDSTRLFTDYHIQIGSHDFAVVNQLGIYAKLCVALFVFVSGYGLEISNNNKDTNIWMFYRKRFTKLYFNYWFIWLLFVPIGVYVFGRTFSDVYGNNLIIKCLFDILGLIRLSGLNGYNPTWWFYSCIIVLYVLYPLLHRLLSSKWLLILSVSILIVFGNRVPFLAPISNYLLPFFAGMCVARIPVQIFSNLKVRDVIFSFILLSIVRNFSDSLVYLIDTLLCINMAVFLFKVKIKGILLSTLRQLGKHSQNIFLFHTFIFAFWFEDFIYMSRNPLIIFLSLVIICYLISIVLEYVKQITGFYSLIDRIAIPLKK